MEETSIKHALIIEDDGFFSELLGRRLAEMGFRVTVVPSVGDAKKALQSETVDVVCFDMVVSGGDGLKTLSEFKTGTVLKNAPLLLLVDKELERRVSEWVGADAVEYLVKQESSPEDIALKIESLVRA